MGPSFRQTVAQIFGDERMSESTMLASHRSATVSRAQTCGGDYLIAAQDTTFYTYSGQRAMAGLGTVQGQVRGVLQHNALLMSESGQPLGLLDQQYWTRQGGKDLPEGESESQKWLNGLERVNAQVGELAQAVVVVADREADVFAYVQAERAANVALLVRVHQPRTLTVCASGVSGSLPEVVPHLDDVGTTVVRSERQHREVDVTLRLQAGAVTVAAPTAGPKQPPLEGFSLVAATEVACVDAKTQADRFDPDHPVVWLLLTSLPVDTPEAVQRVLRFYALRWRIERFHYTLKSGALKVESCQFDDIHTLVNALAFYSVVAWQLLALTYALRDDPDQSAETCFTPEEIILLQQVSTRSVNSVADAIRALGSLVGFAPSKRQPWPGVKVLAMAIERFYFVKLGAMASSKPLQD
jgi:hypothetical protein